MTSSKACFFSILLVAFFISSCVLAREFPNEADDLKGSTNNNLQWTIPLTPSKIEKNDYTTPSVGYYSRNPNWDSNPVLPMLFFFRNKNKKPKEPPKTTPPEKHNQNPNTNPLHQHNPPHQPFPHYPNDPSYLERPGPLMGQPLPSIAPLLEPLIPGPNVEDQESRKVGSESEKIDPESKKVPPPNDEEEDSMDNTAHHAIGYKPYSSYQSQNNYYTPLFGYQSSGKRFSAYNKEEVDELKGSNNNLQWTIPLTPTIIDEKDQYTNPSDRNYHRSNTPILPMLFLKKKQPPNSEPKPDPPNGPNHDPNTGQYDPHHDPHHDPNTYNHDPYRHDPNTGPYHPYRGGHSGMMDPYNDRSSRWLQWLQMIKEYGREIADWWYGSNRKYPDPSESTPDGGKEESSLETPHSSIRYNPYSSYQYHVLSTQPKIQSNNYYTLSFGYNPNHYSQWNHRHVSPKILNGGYYANFAGYQPSAFQHIGEAENYKNGIVIWNHKMNSPSEIGWSTSYGDNEKEPMN